MKFDSRALASVLALLLLVLAGTAMHARGPAEEALSGIDIAQLPPEARNTLRLIERGGPFPYRKDGTVFGNRERVLPANPRGYYREYTVPTPGSRDRGARRIVTGEKGERYYTADHYRSFNRILQ